MPTTYNETRLFGSNPAPGSEAPDSPLNVGIRIYTFTIGAYLTAVWWYRPTGSTSSVPVRVFDPSGVITDTWTATASTEAAWNRLDLPTPRLLTTGAYWTVSVHTTAYGYYPGQFSANIFTPPLYADGNPGANNGVYVYSSNADVIPPVGSSPGDGYGVDTSVGTRVFTALLTDPVGGVDSTFVAYNGLAQTEADVSGLTDTTTQVAFYNFTVDDVALPATVINDVAGITDTMVANSGTSPSRTDVCGIGESVVAATTSPRTVPDVTGITDSVTAVVNGTSYAATVSDSLGVPDSQAEINVLFRAIVDRIGGLDVVGSAGVAFSFYFTPPLTFDRDLACAPDGGSAFRLFRHFAREPRGLNVWRLNDGTITSDQPRDPSTVVATYLGGHRHPITQEEASLLTAAGFGVEIQ